MDKPTKEEIKEFMMDLQDEITNSLESVDGAGLFQEDNWQRDEGGGGRTRIIQSTGIEKGGVNFSAVHGEMPENISQALGLGKTNFFATGVSIVLHPVNPHVPIIHMNVRYFETSEGKYWFGGGIDLTPHYIDVEDATFFHQSLKDVCDHYDSGYYPDFKKWADDYFYIRHRKETRGIGGIFFDRLAADDHHSKKDRFAFVKDVGRAFVPIYAHLFEKNNDRPYSQAEKDWQYVRRGRYVEFNLVWDKGTKFGLHTNGRIESILMSLPAQANWAYNHQPTPDSPEAETLKLLRKDIDWIAK